MSDVRLKIKASGAAYDDITVEVDKCPHARRLYVFICSPNGTDIRLSPRDAFRVAAALNEAARDVEARR